MNTDRYSDAYDYPDPATVRPSLRARRAKRAATALGWFSIGLGLAELLWPRRVSSASGLHGLHGLHPLLRAYGLREIAAGAGLLASRDPEPWLWVRVAGDALDIATVGARRAPADKLANTAALIALAGVAMVDVAAASALRADKRRQARPVVDYGDRSGLPRDVEQMRGAAADFEVPRDFRTPQAMRPYAP